MLTTLMSVQLAHVHRVPGRPCAHSPMCHVRVPPPVAALDDSRYRKSTELYRTLEEGRASEAAELPSELPSDSEDA